MKLNSREINMTDAVRFTEVMASLEALKGKAYAKNASGCASLLNLLKGAEDAAAFGGQEATLALLGMVLTLAEPLLPKLSGIDPGDIAMVRKALRADSDDLVAAERNNPKEN